jgi:transcription antitermination factor NusG
MRNRSEKPNRGARLAALCVALAAALTLAGCAHKLVASAGQHTVKVYPDQATYDKLTQLKSEGGPMGMLGGIGQSLAARQVDDQTPVRIISNNDQGSEIEVTDGPFKGLKGFVPKQNVN